MKLQLNYSKGISLILKQIPVIFKGDPLNAKYTREENRKKNPFIMERFLDMKGKLKIWLLSF
jgi:hypothetical protein